MVPFEDYKYILMVLLITLIKKKCKIFIPWIMYMIIFIIVATTDKTKNL